MFGGWGKEKERRRLAFDMAQWDCATRHRSCYSQVVSIAQQSLAKEVQQEHQRKRVQRLKKTALNVIVRPFSSQRDVRSRRRNTMSAQSSQLGFISWKEEIDLPWGHFSHSWSPEHAECLHHLAGCLETRRIPISSWRSLPSSIESHWRRFKNQGLSVVVVRIGMRKAASESYVVRK